MNGVLEAIALATDSPNLEGPRLEDLAAGTAAGPEEVGVPLVDGLEA